jgi:hypothetical protein
MSKYSCSPGDPLDMLAEECAELIQALMKFRRFGADGAPGYTGMTPREEIRREVGDVLCSIDRLIVSGFMSKGEAILACANKHERIKELFGEMA